MLLLGVIVLSRLTKVLVVIVIERSGSGLLGGAFDYKRVSHKVVEEVVVMGSL